MKILNALSQAKAGVSPRVAMARRLWKVAQPLITKVTGAAGPDDVERFRHTGETRMAMALGQFGVGVLGGLALAAHGGWAWLGLPLTTLMAAGAARAFQTSFVHHASHGTLVRNNRKRNDFLGELASTLAWLQPLQEYRDDHVIHHGELATENDPDLRFIRDKLGFRPGLTRAEYWRRLRWLLVSPGFQISRSLTRFKSNLIDTKGGRRLGSWLNLLAMAGLACGFGPLPFLAAYVVPVFVMHNQAPVLQTISEHTWVYLGYRKGTRDGSYLRLTWTRYMGEPLPEEGAGALRMFAWFLKLCLVHAPLKGWVVPLDLTDHAVHHIVPTLFDWARAAFARRELKPTANLQAIQHQEVWGLKAAIDLTFDHLSLVPRDADLGDRDSYGWIDPELLQM